MGEMPLRRCRKSTLITRERVSLFILGPYKGEGMKKSSRHPHKPEYPKTCPVCGKPFMALLPHGIFCSPACYNKSRTVAWLRGDHGDLPVHRAAQDIPPARVQVTCLTCGKRFMAKNKFIRTCRGCKDLHSKLNHLSDWCRVQSWGG